MIIFIFEFLKSFSVYFTLKIDFFSFLFLFFFFFFFLGGGGYQNNAYSILTRLGKTNKFFTFSRKLEAMSNNSNLNKES